MVENASVIEKELRRKLFTKHLKMKQQFLEEDMEYIDDAKSYWELIESEVDLETESSIEKLFKLVGIGLFDSGLDDHGFVSFEFQTVIDSL